jgi:hypothetical protein
LAQEDAEDYRLAYGTTAHPDAPDLHAAAALAPIKPIVAIPKSSYATGGVGLRNHDAGNISVSGLVGEMDLKHKDRHSLRPQGDTPLLLGPFQQA